MSSSINTSVSSITSVAITAETSNPVPSSASAANGETPVIFVSSDEKRFTLPKKIAVQSLVVQDLMEGNDQEPIIPFPLVTGDVMERVVAFMIIHETVPLRQIPIPLEMTVEEYIDTRDKTFITELSVEMTIKVLLAANYMNIKSLKDLLCAKIASNMRGKTPEEIRTMFGIKRKNVAASSAADAGESSGVVADDAADAADAGESSGIDAGEDD